MTVLVVTNDFPPRRGGIESFVWSLCRALEPDSVVVHAPSSAGSDAVDEAAGFRVVRDPSSTLLPTPAVARRVEATLREHRAEVVVFGASAPLGLLAARARRAGARRTVALTHGHEAWWAAAPGARRLLRKIGDDNDVLTYVSEYSRQQIARALSPAAVARMRPLRPGIDLDLFDPRLDGSRWRREWGIADDAQLVLSASRLVRRKGHDVLLAAWPAVRRAVPSAALVIAGDGARRAHLERQARALGPGSGVRIVPGVPWDAMPERYAAADVFALPCRTRLGGLEPEALGIVFLEAAATGLPVVVGRSGGAPETVLDGESGVVVDPRDPASVAAALVSLLGDRSAAVAMGLRGRDHVARSFGSAETARRFRDLVSGRFDL